MGFPNVLYVWDDRFLYLTEGIASGYTQRHTVTLLLSLNDTPFTLCESDGAVQPYHAALVGKQVTRSLDAGSVPLLSLNFDPQSYEYHALSAFLGEEGVKAVTLDDAALPSDWVRRCTSEAFEDSAFFRLTTQLPRAIVGYQPIRMPIDMRVMHIAQKIKKELPLTSTVAELGEEVGLSQDRLTHLFSESLGISIKSYLLWARMRRAVECIARGDTLISVAHDVGFSDSAHLARTLKAFFGLTPSFLARSMHLHMK
ncbi:Transcriptional regulator, AraC family [Alloalcanivorax dieselolei B5]|uniref:Transcriptional regulator, AraC family n=1 Tax=Alcanivorax dieselolei (strain DSM 16502 / CGMCC 1.3690 / MCCC 1A00001 / B-5) TaxID=930169 RepID=K0C675_ALCDB|nr:AraC family transcriptional regulator [Alloalcanivorax dieselolei]AFT68969.1 Transcriptional regulator, AraC family [Alloalcanivorax dieselolei B5]GGJ81558.1 putative transcriptional regulator, AraC family protein [Alloalcanivorax dieselolei]